MEKENLSGVTKAPMMVTFIRIISMEMVNTSGLTVEFTVVNGLTIKWRARAHSHGVMAEDM